MSDDSYDSALRDLGRLADALGLGSHARPYPPAQLMDECISRVEDLRQAAGAALRDLTVPQHMQDLDTVPRLRAALKSRLDIPREGHVSELDILRSKYWITESHREEGWAENARTTERLEVAEDKVAQLREVLAALVEHSDGQVGISMGEIGPYCRYCDNEASTQIPHAFAHAPDCPITRARELLNEKSPARPEGESDPAG